MLFSTTGSSVAIMLIELDADLLPRNRLAKSLPGCVAGGVTLLGSVDPGDSDSVLLLTRVEDCDRTALGNVDF